MHRLLSIALAAFLLAAPAFSQEAEDIRAPDINAESPDGALIAEAAASEDDQEKIRILEDFLSQFGESRYKGYALIQLQGAYVRTQQHAKTLEVGKQLLEIVPDDVEVRHNINQAMVGLGQWEELYPNLVETRPLAEAAAAAEQPEDPDDDELALWQGQVDYASGVVQYVEWAMNTAMTQQTDPARKIAWLDRLVENYPESDYVKGIESTYVTAYQQAGDQAKAVEWMQKAVDNGAMDESYYYSLAENALAEQDNAKAKEYAQKSLEILEAKTAPEGVAPEQWEQRKAQISAYSNFVLGRAFAAANTKPAYRTGRAHMLKSVDVIKAEGGPRYGVLAYYLGVCYVQLDIQGDNIKKAVFWMQEAANTPGPLQPQAKKDLENLKAAI